MSENYPWWKYYQRPLPSLQELTYLEDRLQVAKSIVFMVTANGQTAKHSANDVDEIGVSAVSHAFDQVYSFDLLHGRSFSSVESATGKPVAIIGFNIAEKLFGQESPIGQEIKFMNQKATIIGVFSEVGDNLVGNSDCLLYTSPSPRDGLLSRMPSSA